MDRWLVGLGRGGVALALAGSATALGTAAFHRDAFTLGLAVLSLLVLSVPVVGAAAIRSAAHNPVSWILLGAGTALPVAIAGFVYARAAYRLGADLPGASFAAWLDGWPWVPAMLVAPTAGILLFPDGRLPGRRWRALLVLDVVLAIGLLVSTLFESHTLDFSDHANLTALPGTAGDVATDLGGLIVLVAPTALAGAIAFERRRRRAEPSLRAVLDQVRPAVWLIVASWWACIVIGVGGGDTLDALPAEAVGMAALGAACWVAIRRHGLFDARLAVRRGLVYGSLTAAVIAIYAAAAAVLTVLGTRHLATPIALGIGVAVAVPLHTRLQRAANRLVFGVRDDPYETVLRLGEQLETTAVADQVLANAARSLRETQQVGYVAIALADEVIAEAGERTGEPGHDLPLVFAGETIGALRVEPDEGESLTPGQLAQFAGIAGQVAAAAHATALSRALAGSRERLVAATEEERRRLRRDLHDGLGPTLSAAVLGLRRARSLLEDRAAAARQLDQLTVQIQDAVADVRRLVYGLRPPALDELGLVGALREHASRLGPVTVTGPTEPLVLGAAVEVAAYRIALEAMTNATRHARAECVTVGVSIDDHLHLEIADDGVGLPEGFSAGVGITSMRERAGELGGRCVIERRRPTGTLVRASVPLEPA